MIKGKQQLFAHKVKVGSRIACSFDRNTCSFDRNTCSFDRNTCSFDRNTEGHILISGQYEKRETTTVRT